MDGKSAKDLFPEIISRITKIPVPKTVAAKSASPKKARRPGFRKPVHVDIEPPLAPDVSWLREGGLQAEEDYQDRKSFLVVSSNPEAAKLIAEKLGKLHYRSTFARSASEAIRIIRSGNLSGVINHFAIEFMEVHKFMCWLPQNIRRQMFYVLMGDQLHTLYDLEAFAHSANIVVNMNELPYFDRILIKGMQDYEELYASFLEVLDISA